MYVRSMYYVCCMYIASPHFSNSSKACLQLQKKKTLGSILLSIYLSLSASNRTQPSLIHSNSRLFSPTPSSLKARAQQQGNKYIHASILLSNTAVCVCTYLDRRVEREVLPSRERLELGVELRAVPHQSVDLLRVLAHVEAAQVSRPRRGR